MTTATTPAPFIPGARLIDGSALNAALAKPIVSAQDGIVAHAGGGKTSATQITAVLNNVITVATLADSIKLPASLAGLTVRISNNGANALQVFGSGTDTINSVATGTGVAQAAGSTIDYECITQGNWIGLGAANGAYTGTFDGVVGGVTPAAGTFTTLTTTGATSLGTTLGVTGNATFSTYVIESVGAALTAVGTNRGTALQLAKQINRVTTAASGTGVILPVGVVGMRIAVFNDGVNAIKVYASGSETIDGTAGSTGVTLTNALRCEYFFTVANTWISAQLGAVSA